MIRSRGCESDQILLFVGNHFRCDPEAREQVYGLSVVAVKEQCERETKTFPRRDERYFCNALDFSSNAHTGLSR